MTLADHLLRAGADARRQGKTHVIGKDAIRCIEWEPGPVRVVFSDGSAIVLIIEDYSVDNSKLERYVHGKGNIIVATGEPA